MTSRVFPTSPVRRRLYLLVGFTCVYALSTYLGRATRPEDSQIALAWPAAGVGVWFLASTRGRVELLAAAGAVATGALLANLDTGVPAVAAAVFAVINASHASVGTVALRRLLPGGTGLRHPEDVARLLAAAALTAAVSGSASAGAAAVLLDEPFWSSLLLFVVRNGGATFVLLAAVLSLSAPHSRRELWSLDRVVELGLIGAGSAATFAVVFAAPNHLPILFIALGSSVLAGTRLGVPRAGLLALVLSVLAVTGTLLGRGALAGVDDVHTRAVLVQVFIVLVMVVSLFLATLQRSKDDLAAHLAASLQELEEANRSALVGKAVVIRGEDGGWCLTRPNPALVDLLGRDPTGVRWRELLVPGDAGAVRTALDDIAADRRARWEGEVRHRRPDGRAVWTHLLISTLGDRPGTTAGSEVGKAVVVQVLDIDDRHAAHEALQRLAHVDVLTGLPNRATLDSDLSAALTAGTAAVMFLDLDRFKAVNDTYGHESGDRILVQVAAALRATLRPGDLVARLGGDEFVVCCPGVALAEDGDRLVERLQHSVDPALRLDGRDVGLGVSIGLAIGSRGERADAVLGRSDLAMYAIKRRSDRVSGLDRV